MSYHKCCICHLPSNLFNVYQVFNSHDNISTDLKLLDIELHMQVSPKLLPKAIWYFFLVLPSQPWDRGDWGYFVIALTLWLGTLSMPYLAEKVELIHKYHPWLYSYTMFLDRSLFQYQTIYLNSHFLFPLEYLLALHSTIRHLCPFSSVCLVFLGSTLSYEGLTLLR